MCEKAHFSSLYADKMWKKIFEGEFLAWKMRAQASQARKIDVDSKSVLIHTRKS